jgi:rhodanese-related sulfurtransferase
VAPDARVCAACGAQVSQVQSKQLNRGNQQKQRVWLTNLDNLVLRDVALLILIGILLIITTNCSGSIADNLDQETPDPEVPRISLADAKTRYDAGTALFADVRLRGDYYTAHIPNAVLLPLAELEDLYRRLPREAEIILYDSWSSNEQLSAHAGLHLMSKGYNNVQVIRGGFRAWNEAGYPVISGE